MLPRTNTHIHLPPNFSAFARLDDALKQASAEGIVVLGASNYYDWSVYDDFARKAAARGIFPLFGLETLCLIPSLVDAGVRINDPGNPGKMYLCGKGFGPGFAQGSARGFADFGDDTPAAATLAALRENDAVRMAQMTARLASLFADAGLATGLTADTLLDALAARTGRPRASGYLQERHVAQGFAEAVFAAVPDLSARTALLTGVYGAAPKAAPDDLPGVQNDIRSLLMKAGKAAFVPDTYLSFGEVFGLIEALGGLPVYPLLADGADPVCPYEADVSALIADLQARGIVGVEFIPPRNEVAVVTRYAVALRASGLLVTAGTEHNTPERPSLVPVCKDGVPIPDAVAALFWEGACVIAAHQGRRERGEAGFGDVLGDTDTRIRAFAAEGAALVQGITPQR